MSSVVVCGFSQNCTPAQAPTGGWKAVHVNRKRFGAESNLIYFVPLPSLVAPQGHATNNRICLRWKKSPSDTRLACSGFHNAHVSSVMAGQFNSGEAGEGKVKYATLPFCGWIVY